jgi:hypothetical protein
MLRLAYDLDQALTDDEAREAKRQIAQGTMF